MMIPAFKMMYIDTKIKTNSAVINANGTIIKIATIIVGIILAGGLWLAFTMVRQKNRYPLLIETILIPIVFLMLFFAYPPLFVLFSSTGVAFAWLATALVSPKLIDNGIRNPTKAPNIVTSFPTINCPQCGVPNPVTSDERPIRLECTGCGRIIKIVA